MLKGSRNDVASAERDRARSRLDRKEPNEGAVILPEGRRHVREHVQDIDRRGRAGERDMTFETFYLPDRLAVIPLDRSVAIDFPVIPRPPVNASRREFRALNQKAD